MSKGHSSNYQTSKYQGGCRKYLWHQALLFGVEVETEFYDCFQISKQISSMHFYYVVHHLAVNVGGRYRNMTFSYTECDYNNFSIQVREFQRK